MKPVIKARMPEAQRRRMAEVMERFGMNESELIRKAIARYLDNQLSEAGQAARWLVMLLCQLLEDEDWALAQTLRERYMGRAQPGQPDWTMEQIDWLRLASLAQEMFMDKYTLHRGNDE